MKSLNEKESIILHAKYGVHMLFLVIVTLFFIFSFLKTSEAEIDEISLKSGNSEAIYYSQIELTDKIEEFFDLYSSFDASDEVNAGLLMRSIVDRKMEINKRISDLPQNDAKVHAFLMSKVDGFLSLRDSISQMKDEEARVKKDYMDCSGDYRNLVDKRRDGSFYNR